MFILLVTFLLQILSPSEIVFFSQTRGGMEKITIQKNKIFLENNGVIQSYEITQQDWRDLIRSTQHVDYEKINQYPAPSNDRARDAAWHSTITIRAGDQTYTSNTFDDKKAPAQLVKLMHCITELSKKYTPRTIDNK